MSLTPNIFEIALQEASADKKAQIPYLIIDPEFSNKTFDQEIAELVSHPEIRKIITQLSTDNPQDINTLPKLITESLEIEPQKLSKNTVTVMEEERLVSFSVELKNNSERKIVIKRDAGSYSQVVIESTSQTECTSPDNSTLTKKEYYNSSGQKISDHYQLNCPLSSFKPLETNELLASHFYIRIVTFSTSNISDRSHPKNHHIEVGLTTFQGGDQPILVTSSENDSIDNLTTIGKSAVINERSELETYFTQLILSYGSIILNRKLMTKAP